MYNAIIVHTCTSITSPYLKITVYTHTIRSTELSSDTPRSAEQVYQKKKKNSIKYKQKWCLLTTVLAQNLQLHPVVEIKHSKVHNNKNTSIYPELK